MNRMKKRALVLSALIAVPMLFASAAWACQALTTAYANPKSGPVGTSVAVTGGGYDNRFDVQIRWDSRYAPPLATVRPVNGWVSATITVPNSTTGYHTILITQKVLNSSGVWVDKSGTPGRASFQVTAGGTSSASSLDPSVLVTPMGLAGLLLMVAVSRRPRRRTESTTA